MHAVVSVARAALLSGGAPQPLCPHRHRHRHHNRVFSHRPGHGRPRALVGGGNLAVVPSPYHGCSDRRPGTIAAVIVHATAVSPSSLSSSSSFGAGAGEGASAAPDDEGIEVPPYRPYYVFLESEPYGEHDDTEEEDGEEETEQRERLEHHRRQRATYASVLSVVSAAVVCCTAGAPPAWAGSDGGRHSRSKLREKEERYEREQGLGGGGGGSGGGGGTSANKEDGGGKLVKMDDGQLTVNFKGAKKGVEGLGDRIKRAHKKATKALKKKVDKTVSGLNNGGNSPATFLSLIHI